MHPYTAARVEKYRTLRGQIEALHDLAVHEQRDLSEEELTQVRADQARRLYREIEFDIDEENRQAKVAQLALRVAEPAEPTADDRERIPNLMPSAGQIDAIREAIKGDNPRALKFTTRDAHPSQHDRAVVTLATDLGTPKTAIGGVVGEPLRIATVAGLPTEHVNGASEAVFPVFGAGTAGIAAEAGAKTEYDAISPGSAVPQVVNAWTDYTRQAATSHLSFEQLLRQKLAALVASREDQLLQATVGATTGIQTQAAVAGAQAGPILTAAAKVQAAVGQYPDVCLVNPADIFGFFVLLAATLNFGFFIGDIDRPELHNVYELFAAVVVNLIATVLKFGDRTQIGAVHLATSLVADLQLIAAAPVWGYANYVSSAGLTGEATASVVSLSGGALLANIVSVVLLVVETVSFHRR
jgi:Family of unknown function (DUF6394)